VIGSYSFGNPELIRNVETFWKDDKVIAGKSLNILIHILNEKRV
jgi:hypothetical protein